MSSVAVVDGYSTGNYLPPAFARLGLGAVHLLSTPEPRPGLQPPILGAYEAEVVYTGTVEEAAAALGPYRPVAVLAGSEPGVPLADALSERLAPKFLSAGIKCKAVVCCRVSPLQKAQVRRGGRE